MCFGGLKHVKEAFKISGNYWLKHINGDCSHWHRIGWYMGKLLSLGFSKVIGNIWLGLRP